MTQPPNSRDLHNIVQAALRQRIPWRTRLADWLLARLPARISSKLAKNGGYWGGVTMWDRRKK